jgi:hypothetical protein
MRPAIDAVERFLPRVVLRRLVTYYAQRQRFAATEGAARVSQRIGREILFVVVASDEGL